MNGFGRMWQKTYRTALGAVTPQQAITVLKEHFPEFWPAGNRFFAPLAGIAPGEVAALDLTMPGGLKLSTGVLVLYADDESFTLMTPEGHMFAGWITFSAFTEDGQTGAGAGADARLGPALRARHDLRRASSGGPPLGAHADLVRCALRRRGRGRGRDRLRRSPPPVGSRSQYLAQRRDPLGPTHGRCTVRLVRGRRSPRSRWRARARHRSGRGSRTTLCDQSMTARGLTMWRPIPSCLGVRPSASPTSWGRCSTAARARGRPRRPRAAAAGRGFRCRGGTALPGSRRRRRSHRRCGGRPASAKPSCSS